MKRIHFASGAWRDVKYQTILHCFQKASFSWGSSTARGEMAAADIGAAAGGSTTVMIIASRQCKPHPMQLRLHWLCSGKRILCCNWGSDYQRTSCKRFQERNHCQWHCLGRWRWQRWCTSSRDIRSSYRSGQHITHVPGFWTGLSRSVQQSWGCFWNGHSQNACRGPLTTFFTTANKIFCLVFWYLNSV